MPVIFSVSRLVSSRPPALILVLSRARIKSPVPAWLPSDSAAWGRWTVPSWISLAWTRRDRSAASLLDPASSRTFLPRRWSASHMRRRAVHRRLPGRRRASSRAGRSRRTRRNPRPAAAPMRLLPRPRRTGGPRAAPRTGLPGRAAGTSRRPRPRRAARCRRPDQPRPGGPGRLLDHRQVRRAELAGLIQHQHVVLMQRHGPAQLVGAFDLAEELGDVVGLGQALAGQDPGRVGGRGQADHPPAGERGPQPGELGHGVALARPGRGDQRGRRRGGGEHRDHGVALPGGQPGALGGRTGLLRGDQLRHGPFGGGEDLLFGVQVGQGAVPFLVRRPVDAAAVGGPDPQAGHVGEVRRGDLDDLGPGPAGDGQLGHLGDHRLGVGARRQHGQRPVHLEPELGHRPDRVVLLHLGDGDPRGSAFGRIVQHRRCTPGALGGEPGHLLVHRRQGLHFPLCRLCFPGGQPLRGGGLGGAGLPGDGAACFGLGAPGVLRRLLAEQPDRPLGRRLARGSSGTGRSGPSVPGSAPGTGS